MKNNGLTLMELMVVVIVIGILSSVALPKYVRTTEKGRTVEARSVLGRIRSAEMAYFMEFDAYSSCLTTLSVVVPSNVCNASYYYRYTVTAGGTGFTAYAARCTSGGKTPNCPAIAAHNFSLTDSSDLACTLAYLL